jgi:hypothetical protein
MGLAIVGRTCRDTKSTTLWFLASFVNSTPHTCHQLALLCTSLQRSCCPVALPLQIIVAVAINKERPLLPASTPPRLASLISRCWQEEPRQRPSTAAVAAELQDMMQVGLASGGAGESCTMQHELACGSAHGCNNQTAWA